MSVRLTLLSLLITQLDLFSFFANFRISLCQSVRFSGRFSEWSHCLPAVTRRVGRVPKFRAAKLSEERKRGVECFAEYVLFVIITARMSNRHWERTPSLLQHPIKGQC